MKSETPQQPMLDPTEVRERLWKIKLTQSKGVIRIGVAKKHAQANSLYLEINGARRFEIGNDCDTCHFWFKCLRDPRPAPHKKLFNLPKTIALPRPIDAELVRELLPMLDIMEKGEYYLLNTTLNLTGPYQADDESSYFHNAEFQEIWDIEDPAAEDLLSDWEHYEGKTPKVFRHEDIVEKQHNFVIPLVPQNRLKQENVRLYQQMIQNGDRPRVFLFGLMQRPIPETIATARGKTMHSFFAGFVLDGHHKLAAYLRAGVAANCLVLVSTKASKYFLLENEGDNAREKLEERLATFAV
ncbi:MAG: hypothetical protein WCU88_12655 [Elusimicrobiota bacterium]|jgi:hypothetical protein